MFLLEPHIFLWDTLILLLLAVLLSTAIGSLFFSKRVHSSMYAFSAKILGVLCILGVAVILYAAFCEPQMILRNNITVTHSLAPNIRIVLASDPHIGPYKGEKFLQKAVSKINDAVPDIVLLPGDFVFTTWSDLSELSPLQDIRAPLGVFAVLGNHDMGQYATLEGERYAGGDRSTEIQQALEKYGVTVLRNTHELIPTPEGVIAIAGIDDLWSGHYDLSAALNGIPTNAFTILLAHNPSVIDLPESTSAHLIVSGHTHGGQIRFPWGRPVPELPTTLGRDFDEGLFTIDTDTTLLITRGLGESSPRTRLFAWPEVMVAEVHN